MLVNHFKITTLNHNFYILHTSVLIPFNGQSSAMILKKSLDSRGHRENMLFTETLYQGIFLKKTLHTKFPNCAKIRILI